MKKKPKTLRKQKVEDPYDEELYEFVQMRPLGDLGKSNAKPM